MARSISPTCGPGQGEDGAERRAGEQGGWAHRLWKVRQGSSTESDNFLAMGLKGVIFPLQDSVCLADKWGSCQDVLCGQ